MGAFAVARGQESDPPYSSSGRVAQSVKEQSASFAVFERGRTEADELAIEAGRQPGDR